MIRRIHYSSTELKTKIDVIPRGCFKYYNKNKTSKHIKYAPPIKMCDRSVHMCGHRS